MKKSNIKKLSQKTLVVFGVIIILGIILSSFIFIKQGSESESKAESLKISPSMISPGISWDEELDNSVTEEDKGELPEIKHALITEYPDPDQHGNYLVIGSVEVTDQWIRLSGGVYDTENNPVGTEGVTLYGEKSFSGWQIYNPGESGFCEYVKRAPLEWVDSFYIERNCLE